MTKGVDHECDKAGRYYPMAEYVAGAEISITLQDDILYKALFDLLFWTGYRVGELLALTKKYINFERNQISITKTYYRIGR